MKKYLFLSVTNDDVKQEVRNTKSVSHCIDNVSINSFIK